MDIARAFSHPFADQNWLKKALIGGVVMVIPVVDFMGLGYGVRHLRNLLDGVETPLPEWDSWGDDFRRGLYPSLALIIYMIPSALFFWSGLLQAIYALLAALFFLASLLRYARDERFRAFFEFKEAYAFIRTNLNEFIVAWALSLVVCIPVLVFDGVWSRAVAVFLTSYLAMLISFHLLAQVQRKADAADTGTMP